MKQQCTVYEHWTALQTTEWGDGGGSSKSSAGPPARPPGTGTTLYCTVYTTLYWQGRLVALGLNCCPPDLVTAALTALRTVAPRTPFVVYPNRYSQLCRELF